MNYTLTPHSGWNDLLHYIRHEPRSVSLCAGAAVGVQRVILQHEADRGLQGGEGSSLSPPSQSSLLIRRQRDLCNRVRSRSNRVRSGEARI